jgi:hypothetical protein
VWILSRSNFVISFVILKEKSYFATLSKFITERSMMVKRGGGGRRKSCPHMDLCRKKK